MDGMVVVPWLGRDSEAWWDRVVDWVELNTAAVLGVNAQVDKQTARIRPWGVTASVVAGSRRLVFKATEPRRGFEGQLTEFLGHRWPALAPTVHAISHEQHWMLQGYHGEPIADALPAEEQVTAICSLLADYAQMQLATAHLVHGWITSGVPDRRVEHLLEQFETFLRTSALDPGLRERCRAQLPALRRICDELHHHGDADALEHADIHGTNVLTTDGTARLIDWGDCCITHPFTALFVPVHFVVALLGHGDRADAIGRLRDAYLEPWGGPNRENLDTLSRASVVAPLVRVLSLAGEIDGEAEIETLLRDWDATTH